MSQPKILKIRVDASVGRHGKKSVAAYAYYIKPYNCGLRGKSFPGQFGHGILPAGSSTFCEFVGIILAIDHANKFAHICKLDNKSTTLLIESDCSYAVDACNEVKTASPKSVLDRRLSKLISSWMSTEFSLVPRDVIKSVHLEAQRARKFFASLEEHIEETSYPSI